MKNCHIRKIARVDYSSQKIWHRSTIDNGFHGFAKTKKHDLVSAACVYLAESKSLKLTKNIGKTEVIRCI